MMEENKLPNEESISNLDEGKSKKFNLRDLLKHGEYVDKFEEAVFEEEQSQSPVEPKEVLKSNVFEATSLIYVRGNTSIEQNVSKRAISFYKTIKNDKLRKELVQDFTEMEWAYLKNDIVEFSRRAHKQLEAIVNYCLFEKIGLTKLQNDFLTKKGITKIETQNPDGSKSWIDSEKFLGEIIMGKLFPSLQKGTITDINDSNIKLDIRPDLFCYYYLNNNVKGFTNRAVYNYDSGIWDNANYFRKKGSHGWLRVKDSTTNRLNEIALNPGPFYFDVFYLLRKFRFTDAVTKELQT